MDGVQPPTSRVAEGPPRASTDGRPHHDGGPPSAIGSHTAAPPQRAGRIRRSARTAALPWWTPVLGRDDQGCGGSEPRHGAQTRKNGHDESPVAQHNVWMQIARRIATGVHAAARLCELSPSALRWELEAPPTRDLVRAVVEGDDVGTDSVADRLWELLTTEPRRAMDRVQAARRTLLESDGPDLGQSASVALGALGVHACGASFFDGASAHASNEFFDLYDTPPPATWLEVLPSDSARAGFGIPDGSLLVFWVPERLRAPVHEAIHVNPVEALAWLADIAPDLDAAIARHRQATEESD